MAARAVSCALLFLLLLATMVLFAACTDDGTDDDASSGDDDAGDDDDVADDYECDVDNPEYTVGLTYCQTGAFEGYTLFPPKHRGEVYLIDMLGRVVHSWESSTYEPGQSVYLRENGNLVRAVMLPNAQNIGGGEGGRIEEYDWDDNLVWAFDYAGDGYTSHHDIAVMPNGNLLLLAIEVKEVAEAVQAGFEPNGIQEGYVGPEYVVEVAMTGPESYEVVWEWHVWDHLIQDYDPNVDNYGDPFQHPELLDVQGGAPAFWNHANSIAYNADLDQIVISARSHNEVWVIDHSTTSAEAASHEGGAHGHGGDFLYRWGNPSNYGSGNEDDRMLFAQHDSQWIEDDCPGAGNLLIFNNGENRPGNVGYSTIDEWTPPMESDGSYPELSQGEAWGPEELAWQYKADPPEDFYSAEISGAQRLPNGNTLICEGLNGRFLEVDEAGTILWEYINAVDKEGPMAQYEIASLDNKGHFWNAIFKIHRYAPDFAGFDGRDLTPGDVLELDDDTCPEQNVNYTCTDASSCTSGGGEDVSNHFVCGGQDTCCFELTQGG